MRLVAPQQIILKRPDIWRPAERVGWRHWPNVHTTVNTGERTVPYITDQEGFRVGDKGRIEAGKRILLLGDSFMEALQVPYEESFAGLLEKRLPDRVGAPVAVRNTAVGGWAPSQYLIQARESLARDHFDLVLVGVYLGNDVELKRHDTYPARMATLVHHFRIPRHLTWWEFVDAVLFPINDLLEVRSHLFILLKNVSSTLRIRFGLTYLDFPTEYMKRDASSPRWRVTASVLRDIAAIADSAGTRTLFVLLPAAFQVDTKELEQYEHGFGFSRADIDLDQPNRIILAALRDSELNVVDVTPSLRQAQAAGGEQLFGSVDVHFSARGHDVAATASLPAVVDCLEASTGRRATGHDGPKK